MKKKFIYKLMCTVWAILIISVTISNIAFADSITSLINPSSTAVTGSFTNVMDIMIGIFQVVAIGIGAIMIIVLGIKYVSAAPNDKAEIKQHATIYLVGACLAFASSGIIAIFKTFVQESLE